MSHSTSTNDRLVYMANQIATAFSTQHHAEAVASTREHIHKFWDPRMRSKIFEHLDHGGEGLSPIAKEALEGLRATSVAA
ncbi:formate dehydrogenase subunit delta [Xanthobacter sp. VNH20]|uniref:formate dehydrogenase subunit delta n=1 Tax=Xanthobacter sp. VNH20 TaxID=3156616 RepID=UPI0032B39DE5